MACTVCSNLTPETLQYVKSGQLATIFIDEYELSESAHSAGCTECKLLFDAISLERDRWPPSKEQSSSIVINVAIGKSVQIIWNKGLSIFRSVNDPTSKEAQEIPHVIGNAHLFRKTQDLKNVYHSCTHGIWTARTRTHYVNRRHSLFYPRGLSTSALILQSWLTSHLLRPKVRKVTIWL